MDRRTILSLSEKEYLKIKALSTQEKVSMAEILRRSLALYWVKVATPECRDILHILEKDYETLDETLD